MSTADNGNFDLEKQRLDLEHQKFHTERQWRRKTFVWTIMSSLMTAAVTLTVALIAADKSASSTSIPEISEGSVQACRDSLRRLESLSTALDTQTVQSLADAIKRHRDQCDQTLVTLLNELKK